jgi:hypothetical protein
MHIIVVVVVVVVLNVANRYLDLHQLHMYVLPFFLKRNPSEEDDGIEKAMTQIFLPSVCLRTSVVFQENGSNLKFNFNQTSIFTIPKNNKN